MNISRINIMLLTGIFFYVLIRAVSIDLTFDEIWTWNDFVRLPYLCIVSLSPCDANNHILNTILIKILFSWFGAGAFTARLPNVMACVFYLFFVYRFTFLLQNKAVKLLLVLLLCFNPFMLDFFGLARGYGIALSFELAALYYLFYYLLKGSTMAIVLGIVFSVVAVAGNFSFLPFMLGFGSVLFALSIMKNGRAYKASAWIAACYAASAVLLFFPLNKLRMNGNLYYGGSKSLYADTLCTLLKASSANKLDPDYWPFLSLAIIIFIAGFIIANLVQFNFKSTNYRAAAVAATVLIITMAIIWLQHFLLHTPLPVDRTAIYLLPLSALAFVFSYNAIAAGKSRFFTTVLPGAVALVAFCNFIYNANLYKTITWNLNHAPLKC